MYPSSSCRSKFRCPQRSSAFVLFFLFVLWLGGSAPLWSRGDKDEPPVDPELFKALEWRLVGPFRGGRSTAVTGVRGQPLTYYFGGTGGGVWKTEDAGTSWRNISDGQLETGSVGAIAVAESDPNVIYVGMGEADIRGVTTSSGDGVYKSTDAGRTWTHMGLELSRQISAIRIHPNNSNIVFVAAQGNPWTANPERGLYRSIDGGLTWRHVFFVDERTGASDLAMDATNPRILYAAFWEHQRLPWKVVSGGPGSGIYKSTDAGESWTPLTEGLPELMGKIGVAVSPARPDRVWAIVEAEEGGLFRSDDAGKKWQRLSADRILRARSWYYTKVPADPRDADTVYVMNAPFLRSVDGGKTFTSVPTPHGDNHLLWIDPDDPQRMINANDGGANVSWNGGTSWSTQANQPTAQFYRVITDQRFPYFVYGGQQDNSTVAIASRAAGPGIGREDWYPVGGCESAHIAFDPEQPRYVYAGCYQGLISEYDVDTRRERDIMAYPYMGLGSDAADLKYRFNWNAPIVASPHDRSVIYHAGNVVLRSRDRGRSWAAISPDLTRNEKEKQGPGGGPITNEAAGAETYNTIMYFVESPHEAGTFWVGTDDGLVHISRDDGATWNNVTPKKLEESLVNSIEVSPHDPATAWIAVTRYKFGDFTPHIYKTTNYGESWKRLVKGIDDEAFVRVVREDPARAGLLYAGTETGLYISFDAGEKWQPFQLNLPVVSITDLKVQNHDLVAATQGRSFWILDDLTPLHQIIDKLEEFEAFLFQPRDAYRVAWGGGPRTPAGRGANPPSGATLHYYLSEDVLAAGADPEDREDDDAEDDDAENGGTDDDVTNDEVADGEVDGEAVAEAAVEEVVVRLEIRDIYGHLIRSYSSEEPEKDPKTPSLTALGFQEAPRLPAKAGLHRFVWDFKREQVRHIPGVMMNGPGAKAYRASPGLYSVRLSVGEHVHEQVLRVLPDPRAKASAEDLAAQQGLVSAIWGVVDELHQSAFRLREARQQVDDLMGRVEGQAGGEEIRGAGEGLVEKIDAWEAKVIQPKHETFQDVINFPNQLNAQLLFLLAVVDDADPPVNIGTRERFADLEADWLEREAEMRAMVDEDLAAFNALFETHSVPAVILPDA